MALRCNLRVMKTRQNKCFLFALSHKPRTRACPSYWQPSARSTNRQLGHLIGFLTGRGWVQPQLHYETDSLPCVWVPRRYPCLCGAPPGRPFSFPYSILHLARPPPCNCFHESECVTPVCGCTRPPQALRRGRSAREEPIAKLTYQKTRKQGGRVAFACRHRYAAAGALANCCCHHRPHCAGAQLNQLSILRPDRQYMDQSMFSDEPPKAVAELMEAVDAVDAGFWAC